MRGALRVVAAGTEADSGSCGTLARTAGFTIRSGGRSGNPVSVALGTSLAASFIVRARVVVRESLGTRSGAGATAVDAVTRPAVVIFRTALSRVGCLSSVLLGASASCTGSTFSCSVGSGSSLLWTLGSRPFGRSFAVVSVRAWPSEDDSFSSDISLRPPAGW